MPKYTTDATTWFEPPDEVDIIQAAERYEASDDYESDALDWGINDADIVAEIRDRFAVTDAYERGFRRWSERQMP